MTISARRILIVDDNEDSRELYRLLLESKGHHVVEAHDGSKAIELLSSEPFDVAVVDIGLPDIDGYEIARRARAAYDSGRLRLVALTGFAGDRDRIAAIEAGFDIHLAKPIDNEALAAAVVVASERPPVA